MKLQTLKNKIDKYNNKLADAIKEMDGNNEFYSVDCICISCDNVLEPIVIKENKKSVTIIDQTDGEKVNVKLDGKDIEETTELDWQMDAISMYNRMINKTLRVWRSDNPEAEEDKDDEDNDED